MNGKIAPKSIVMEVADLIPLTGKAETQDAVWQVSRDASGVRTAGMRPKDFMGTREIHQVQAKACRTGQAGKARKVRRPGGSQTG